jgi:hypothetical protein
MSDTLRTDAFAKTKWNWRAPSVDRASVERSLNNATNWTSGHMYRTSYHDMSDKVRITLLIILQILTKLLERLHSYFILFRNPLH